MGVVVRVADDGVDRARLTRGQFGERRPELAPHPQLAGAGRHVDDLVELDPAALAAVEQRLDVARHAQGRHVVDDGPGRRAPARVGVFVEAVVAEDAPPRVVLVERHRDADVLGLVPQVPNVLVEKSQKRTVRLGVTRQPGEWNSRRQSRREVQPRGARHHATGVHRLTNDAFEIRPGVVPHRLGDRVAELVDAGVVDGDLEHVALVEQVVEQCRGDRRRVAAPADLGDPLRVDRPGEVAAVEGVVGDREDVGDPEVAVERTPSSRGGGRRIRQAVNPPAGSGEQLAVSPDDEIAGVCGRRRAIKSSFVGQLDPLVRSRREVAGARGICKPIPAPVVARVGGGAECRVAVERRRGAIRSHVHDVRVVRVGGDAEEFRAFPGVAADDLAPLAVREDLWVTAEVVAPVTPHHQRAGGEDGSHELEGVLVDDPDVPGPVDVPSAVQAARDRDRDRRVVEHAGDDDFVAGAEVVPDIRADVVAGGLPGERIRRVGVLRRGDGPRGVHLRPGAALVGRPVDRAHLRQPVDPGVVEARGGRLLRVGRQAIFHRDVHDVVRDDPAVENRDLHGRRVRPDLHLNAGDAAPVLSTVIGSINPRAADASGALDRDVEPAPGQRVGVRIGRLAATRNVRARVDRE